MHGWEIYISAGVIKPNYKTKSVIMIKHQLKQQKLY